MPPAPPFRAAYGHLLDEAALERYVTSHYTPDRQRQEIEAADSVVLLAEASGDLMGFTWVCRGEAPASVTVPDAVNLARIYVNPSAQSSGVGRQLMRAAEAEARGMGGSLLWLAVWEKNPRAVAFYRREGFTEIGRTGFPDDPDPECDLVMAKGLISC
jgi:GNAT superfamily N-acetyltransferase